MSRILVLGGARSGKSTWAEQQLARADAVDYVATSPGRPDDAEWVERIRLHQQRRPAHWRTLETRDVAGVLERDGAPVLIDCLGTWLTAICDEVGVWTDESDADQRLAGQVEHLVRAWQLTDRHAIAVSNEVGMGVVPSSASGRRFRDDLGRLNMAMAAASDEVYLLVAGLASRLK